MGILKACKYPEWRISRMDIYFRPSLALSLGFSFNEKLFLGYCQYYKVEFYVTHLLVPEKWLFVTWFGLKDFR